MRVWRWVGAFVFVGVLAGAMTAYGQQSSEKPTWKAFDEKDKPFWQEMKTKTNQTMKVQGMEVTQEQTQTFFVQWTPKGKDGNTWDVEYKIVGVKMDIQIGGNNINYDSFLPKEKIAPNPLTDFFGALVGSTFKLKVVKDDKDGIKVTDVNDTELKAFIDRLAAANDQLKPLLKNILTKESVQQMSNPTFAAFPRTDKDWTDGKWSYESILNMGPIGSYKTTYDYTVDKDKTKVNVSGKMEYKAPDSKDGGGLPFTIQKDSSLTAEKIAGTVTLDTKAGRISESSIQMDLKGKLSIDISGSATMVELTQKQVSTVKTLDTDPVPKAK